eukprot:scaffold129646_cov84-Phaeocystis_antarctica.AAC.1
MAYRLPLCSRASRVCIYPPKLGRGRKHSARMINRRGRQGIYNFQNKNGGQARINTPGQVRPPHGRS